VGVDAGEMSPDEIRRIRESLRLSQTEAGELLGGGPRAFTKYETGHIKPAASVVNLLRVLDQHPKVLETLTGRRVAPMAGNDTGPFEVTGAHVVALTPQKLAALVRRLLASEALRLSLPRDAIHVAANLTAPDGGEDARIAWEGGPDRTSFLPRRICQFQLKAGPISPANAAADVFTSLGSPNVGTRDVLEAGGAYLMLSAHSYTQAQITARRERISQKLTAANVEHESDQIHFRDADQIAMWVNENPAVAVWLLEQTQPGLGPFRSWAHWAGRHEHETSPWVPDARLPPLRDKLHEIIGSARGVARVVGQSGVGKSRLMLAGLGQQEGSKAPFWESLDHLVLYAVESEAGSTDIKTAVQSLVDASWRAVVVIDRCLAETHRDLAAMVARSTSNLSLITIDHEIPQRDTLPDNFVLVDKAEEPVIEGILQRIAPDLPSEDHRRLLKNSAGNPRMATLLGQSWVKEGSIASATDEQLFDHVILGRRPDEASLSQDTAMLLSVFGLLGDHAPLNELAEVASLGQRLSVDDLRTGLDRLRERGVVQRRGRLFNMQPPPIALSLAERQWRRWSAATWDQVLVGSLSPQLRIRAAQQLALLNDRKIATEVTGHVCRLGGPLGTWEGFKRAGNAQVVSSLAEIDTELVGTLLEHLFSRLDASEQSSIEGDLRRHLVWALQKIAFVSRTFEQGALLLLDLGVAENERYANNASGQFKALFPVLLADTEAGPVPRLQLLDDLIAEYDERRMPLVVEALLKGAKTDFFSRSVGNEIHGSRPALVSWQPNLWEDAWDYVIQCADRLARLATHDDDFAKRARVGLAQDLRMLVVRGFIENVEGWVKRIRSVHGYWPEALASLGDVMQHDATGLDDTVVLRVRKLIDTLKPQELGDRVRFLVTEMPWDFPVDEKVKFEERGQIQVEAVNALALDLLKSPQVLAGFFPQLSSGSQRMAHAFGQALAHYSDAPLQWLEPVKAALIEIPPEGRNFGLLAGYLNGLNEREPKAVEAFKDDAVRSRDFAPALPIVCASIGIKDTDVELVCFGLRTGLIKPFLLVHWTFGNAMASLRPRVLAPLFDLMLGIDKESYSVALDMIGMYTFDHRERLEELRPQIRLAARNASVRPKKPGSHMDAHHFEELMTWILGKGRDDADARAVALDLGKQLADDPEGDSVDLIKPLLPILLSGFSEIVWPLLGQAIVSGHPQSWRFEHLLADTYSFDAAKNPSILRLPEEALFSWCHAHPEVAPAFVAAIVPVLTSNDPETPGRTIHPVTQRLLDEFGDQKGVLSSLESNMHTFGWRGTPATYFSLYREPFGVLETHPIGAVRRWAKKMVANFQRQIDAARQEEEERKAKWDV